MNSPIIEVNDVWKIFNLPQERYNTAKQALVNIYKKKKILKQEVLKGINFVVNEGEFFGIVGKNGSGKSTLLKMLAGIYVPNSGTIKIRGKVSPFLELGVGFNPELTGIENIYLNGSILGLSKKQIDEKLNDIISFSELEEFMDQKLKNYSSGMQVRLAFSVAIHAHAPIILLDEILAVGDANFQQKCSNEFTKLKRSGRTIIFVSHSMDAVIKYCDRAILIDEGKIIIDGSPSKVAYEYNRLNLLKINKTSSVKMASNEWGDGRATINDIYMTSPDGNKIDPLINMGDNFSIVVNFKKCVKETLKLNFAIAVYKDNLKCFDTNTYDKDYKLALKEEENIIKFNILSQDLLPGVYQIYFTLFGGHTEVYHSKINAINFQVLSEEYDTGVIPLKYSWEYNDNIFKVKK